jgi:hypothetical protein
MKLKPNYSKGNPLVYQGLLRRQKLRRWKELVLEGRLEEAEQLFQGELQIYTYKPINERLACEVTLLRPLIICETSVAVFEKPRVATVLAPDFVPEAMERHLLRLGGAYAWERESQRLKS